MFRATIATKPAGPWFVPLLAALLLAASGPRAGTAAEGQATGAGGRGTGARFAEAPPESLRAGGAAAANEADAATAGNAPFREPAAAGNPTAAVELEGWRAPVEARAVPNPVPATEETVAAAEQLFTLTCAKCHGAAGKGDGRGAIFLDHPPPDFARRVPFQQDGELFWKITNGHGQMPSFRKDLEDAQRWGVIHHLRALAPADETGARDGSGDGGGNGSTGSGDRSASGG